MFKKADTQVDNLIDELEMASPGPEQDAVAEKLFQLGQKNPNLKSTILFKLHMLTGAVYPNISNVACLFSAKIIRSGIQQDDATNQALDFFVNTLEPHTPFEYQASLLDLLTAWSETKLTLETSTVETLTYKQTDFADAFNSNFSDEAKYDVNQEKEPDIFYVMNVDKRLEALLKNDF